MKTLTVLLISALMLSEFSCIKKGEDDPTISIRSRKNRVVGEWRIQKGTITITQNSYTIKYQINGNTVLATDNYGSVSGTASTNYVFNRDGTCSFSINMAGFISSVTGTWNFTSGVGDLKNKSQIVIHPVTVSDGSGTYTIQGNDNDFTYDLLELRHKVIHMTSNDRVDASNGDVSAYSENPTLEPM